MKKLFLIALFVIIKSIEGFAQSQEPCYIKYTYDMTGNRVKREFLCGEENGGGGGPIDPEEPEDPNARPAGNNGNTDNNSVNYVHYLVKVFPNPSASIFNLSVDKVAENASFRVITSKGQVLVQGKIMGLITQIDLSAFATGNYYLEISNGRLEETITLMKQ